MQVAMCSTRERQYNSVRHFLVAARTTLLECEICEIRFLWSTHKHKELLANCSYMSFNPAMLHGHLTNKDWLSIEIALSGNSHKAK